VITIDRFDFLGVWDTVDAYGGPIEEITRAIDYWYWPLSMPDQFMDEQDRPCLSCAGASRRSAMRSARCCGRTLCAQRQEAGPGRRRLDAAPACAFRRIAYRQ